MILKTEDFKNACKTILAAIDSKEATLLTETLELKTVKSDVGGILKLNVTNREYFVTVEFPMEKYEAMDAAVNASVFLRLVSKLTTDTIEIVKKDTYINLKGNGDYKLPIIFNNDRMIELPEIEIENVTNTMSINSDILHSIAIYNSKELQRGEGVNAVQKYYYVDEKGAITFTTGACVNSFTLPASIKMLLSDKLVKLFKLFTVNTPVEFKMGQDAITEDIIQTKVRFAVPGITITAKLSDSGLVSSVPVTAIRTMANKDYTYSVVFNKEILLDSITRLLLLNDSPYGYLEFTSNNVSIKDSSKENTEVIPFVDECKALKSYNLILNITNLKLILDTVEEEYITVNFGDEKAVVVKNNNIVNIIQEVKIK